MQLSSDQAPQRSTSYDANVTTLDTRDKQATSIAFHDRMSLFLPDPLSPVYHAISTSPAFAYIISEVAQRLWTAHVRFHEAVEFAVKIASISRSTLTPSSGRSASSTRCSTVHQPRFAGRKQRHTLEEVLHRLVRALARHQRSGPVEVDHRRALKEATRFLVHHLHRLLRLVIHVGWPVEEA